MRIIPTSRTAKVDNLPGSGTGLCDHLLGKTVKAERKFYAGPVVKGSNVIVGKLCVLDTGNGCFYSVMAPNAKKSVSVKTETIEEVNENASCPS